MFEERGRRRFLRTATIALLTTLGVIALAFFISSGINRRNTPGPVSPETQDNIGNGPNPQQIAAEGTAPGPVTGTELGTSAPQSITAAVAKSASPGVVGISVLRVDSGSLFDRKAPEKWNIGSGVIVSSDGYILTNNHVAGGRNKRIVVSLIDGRNIDGTTVWSDPVLDLAVVKINQTGLTTIPMGDANKLQVGEPAIAIGNPLGLQFQRTVTSGIISALNRTIQIDNNYMEGLVQTDASINPGNSGGPLLNSNGQVVGINTIKVTSAEAIGFAVPINVAIPILQQFIKDGEFLESYMGIFAYDREALAFMNNNFKLNSGIYVANVDKNGPMSKSGIKVGCIITQVDGMDITTMMQLRCYIYTKKPGDVINVTHISGGKTMTVPVRLAAKTKDGLVTR